MSVYRFDFVNNTINEIPQKSIARLREERAYRHNELLGIRYFYVYCELCEGGSKEYSPRAGICRGDSFLGTEHEPRALRNMVVWEDR